MMYLQSLRKLNCSGNMVKTFPMHLCDLVKLREVRFYFLGEWGVGRF